MHVLRNFRVFLGPGGNGDSRGSCFSSPELVATLATVQRCRSAIFLVKKPSRRRQQTRAVRGARRLSGAENAGPELSMGWASAHRGRLGQLTPLEKWMKN